MTISQQNNKNSYLTEECLKHLKILSVQGQKKTN